MNQPGMMGPQGPMGGPPRMNNPNLNPALAIVGALLRHVNPQMAPQVGQAIQDPRQNMVKDSGRHLCATNQYSPISIGNLPSLIVKEYL
jgi:hypothetical protein